MPLADMLFNFITSEELSLLLLLLFIILSLMVPIGIWLIHSKINAQTYVILEQNAALDLLRKEKERENLILMDIADSLRTLKNK